MLDRADTTTDDRERARFVLQLATEAFSPTNSLLGNPGALQRLTETRGKSLLYGLTNFIDDLNNNFGMPRQVDERKFQVGRNLATTPGAVVYRGETQYVAMALLCTYWLSSCCLCSPRYTTAPGVVARFRPTWNLRSST